jgi:hypothetical protein
MTVSSKPREPTGGVLETVNGPKGVSREKGWLA